MHRRTTIAAKTAVMISPGIWAFLASPVLDVRFAAAAALLVLALLNLDHLGLVEVFLVAGYFFANLYQSALVASSKQREMRTVP